jgi:hypothetical protein
LRAISITRVRRTPKSPNERSKDAQSINKLLAYTYLQAGITIGTITSVLSELLPNPTLALFTEASMGMPGFAEALSWFFMLLIQTLIGFFIASIGLRIIRVKS